MVRVEKTDGIQYLVLDEHGECLASFDTEFEARNFVYDYHTPKYGDRFVAMMSLCEDDEDEE